MRTLSNPILVEAAAAHRARRWLILGGEAGLAVGIASDHEDATVVWQPVDATERAAVGIAPSNLSIDEPGSVAIDVEGIVIAATPDRGLARRWLLLAKQAIAATGKLFIAGANLEGIRPVIGDAAMLFGPALREDYRSRQRLAVFAVDDAVDCPPAWASNPGVQPGTWEHFTLDVAGNTVSLVTQAGVFAGGRVDAGTRLLLDALPNRLAGSVLDAGCGAGIIGIAASLLGAEAVDMTDLNLLAIQAARENIRRPGLLGCRAFAGDVYSAVEDERYGLIASNPPFHRGKATDFTVADRLIREAPAHLERSGTLLVVANAFLAYGKRMAYVFNRVETVSATRQYHVLRASDPR